MAALMGSVPDVSSSQRGGRLANTQSGASGDAHAAGSPVLLSPDGECGHFAAWKYSQGHTSGVDMLRETNSLGLKVK